MRKVLDWLFPRFDELSVFLMTLIMIASVAGSPEAREGVLSVVSSSFAEQPIVTVVVAIFILAVVWSGLVLPIRENESRVMVKLIVLAHTLVVCVANLTWAIGHGGSPIWSFINWMFVVQSLAWLVVLRFRPADDLISTFEANGPAALVAGIACLAALVVATDFFDVPWVYAYSFGFLGMSVLGTLSRTCERLIGAVKAR